MDCGQNVDGVPQNQTPDNGTMGTYAGTKPDAHSTVYHLMLVEAVGEQLMLSTDAYG